MATADHDSGFQLGLGPEPIDPSAGELGEGDSQVWLNGDVLACACPDCSAPMSIRLWLMVADCFRCGASIELTGEQEQQALRLLRQREVTRRDATRQAAGAITPTMLRKTDAGSRPAPRERPPQPARKAPPALPPAKAKPAAPAAPTLAPRPQAAPPRQLPTRRVAAKGMHHGTRQRIRRLAEKGALGVFWSTLLGQFPAWLVSLIFHLAALLLLSLWILVAENEPPAITLATSLSPEDVEGELGPLEPFEEPLEFEDPGALPLDEVQVMDTPGETGLEFESPVPSAPDPLGDLDELRDLTASVIAASASRMFAGRDPEVRAQIVRREGGTDLTEAAVSRGLEWLARHQNTDGSWSLEAWHQAPHAAGKPDGLGGQKNDVAATAMALLPFLGAGQTHRRGQYTDIVYKGLRWLLAQRRDDGDLRGNWSSQGRDISRMYAHGQAAIVLCEAFALTGDEELRQPAKRSLDFIVQAQHSEGGWRYDPGERGDTSVFGWQVMALRSGKMVYLLIPKETFEKASRYLDLAQADRYGGHYAYQPGGRPTPSMTAEALLCRQYLGWPSDHPGMRMGIDYLLRNLPDKNGPNIYYWYYATQVMHHYGGQPWQRWNARMRTVLVDLQRKDGHLAGSWDPRGGHAESGGRIYMTALAVCTLEVYYRHMPLYRKFVIDVADPSDDPRPADGSPDLELLD